MCKLSIFLFHLCSVAIAQGTDPAGHIFRSHDKGATWVATSAGLPTDAIVSTWVFHQGMIIAGTEADGIYISSDQLKIWRPSSKGLPKGTRILSIASNDRVLFIGTHTKGIFISWDDGMTWQSSHTGLTDYNVRCLNVSDNILLAGTNKGIYRSTDEGKVWQIQKSGVQINDFESAKGQIFAATNQGILTSNDHGETWRPVFSQGAIFDIAVSDGKIYALDYFGTVYTSPTGNFIWLKDDLYLPYQYTFKLSPAGRQFFTAEWQWSYLGTHNLKYNGIPAKSYVNKMLATPVGLFAAVRPF